MSDIDKPVPSEITGWMQKAPIEAMLDFWLEGGFTYNPEYRISVREGFIVTVRLNARSA